MNNKDLENNLLLILKEFAVKNKNITLGLDTKIDHLELDSLDVLDLLMQIEIKLGVNLPIERFSLCYNIGDLMRLIDSLSNETAS
jgi:acyl carrier protein